MNDRLLKSLHETSEDMHEIESMSAVTMREFDALRLPPIKQYSAAQIRRLRRRIKASQAAFAACLNTTVSMVQKWEQGKMRPSGASLKLLDLVDRKGLEVLLQR